MGRAISSVAPRSAPGGSGRSISAGSPPSLAMPAAGGRSISAPEAGGVQQIYRPGRLYGPPGYGGTVKSALGQAGGLWAPFLLAPGEHRIVGMWAAIASQGGHVRLGLWDDEDGRPGALLKDCGIATAAAQTFLKVTFAPIDVDAGPSMRMLHIGAVANGTSLVARHNTGTNEAMSQSADNAMALLGLDPDLGQTFNNNAPAQIGIGIGVQLDAGTVAAGTAFSSNPDLSAGSATGSWMGGLIFDF